MTNPAERYARIHAILNEARGLEGEDRDAFMIAACGDDNSLRAEVVLLLAAASDEGRSDVFADPSVEGARAALEAIVDDATAPWLPKTIGSYTIVRQIGQGGMGSVYEAVQQSPRRSVAIKLLHPIDATPERLRRFRREADLLGRMQHPGIVQIFEAATFDIGRGPQPFFAMELVEGVDIRTHCERHGLDRAARIDLLARVADAVQYAHDHGVVHRDLKPDNLLVNAHGQPRILDFGVAHATDQATALLTMLTGTGQLVGTLAYMAPEQLNDSAGEVTPVVDVYALGVLGFELLTGRLPRTVGSLSAAKAIAVLAENDTLRAGQLDPGLKGDIETILASALASEPGRRYRSAAALATDLRRHLTNLPIEARPPSRIYLARKFARRHTALLVGATATMVIALAGAGVATAYAIDATKRAEALEHASYVSGIAAASSAVQQQDHASASGMLDRLPVAHRGWEYDYLRARLVHHSAEWEPPAPFASAPVFDREGNRMFAFLKGGLLGAWDTSNGRLRSTRVIGGISERNASMTLLHGPSLRFAAVADNGDILIGSLEADAALTRIKGPNPLDAPDGAPSLLAWDAAGQRLLYRTKQTRMWDGARSIVVDEHPCGRAAFDHSGARVAMANEGNVSLLDLASGAVLCHSKLDGIVADLAFAPDDSLLAVANVYQTVSLLDGGTLDVRASLAGHQDYVFSVAWNNDGTRLVSASKDGTVRIWNPRAPESVVVHATGMTGQVSATFVQGAEQADVLVTGERVRRFPLGDPCVLRGHESYVYYVAFSPDGSMLASSGYLEPELHVWDVLSGLPRCRLPAPTTRRMGGDWQAAPFLAFSDDGRRLVATTLSQTSNWDLATAAALPASSDPRPVQQFHETLGHRIWGPAGWQTNSPDGKRVAWCRQDSVVLVDAAPPCLPDAWPSTDPERFPQDAIPWVEGSPSIVGRLVGHVGAVHCVAYSPDGTRIATGGHDATVRIWDAETFELLLVLRGHGMYVKYVAWSPDGKLLASASGDKTIRLWDAMPLSERRAMRNGR